jgi:hypothetical protein
MFSATRPIPPLVLALLTAGVLLAHGLIVRHTAAALAADAPSPLRVFVTRTVQLQAPAPVAAPPTAAATTPARPRRPATAAAPAPAADADPAATPAPLPAAAVEPPLVMAQAPAEAASAPEATAVAAPVPDPVTVPMPPAPATLPPPSTAAAADLPPAASESNATPAPEPRIYAVPPSTRLLFDATGMRSGLQYQANGELSWLHDGARYEARLQLSAFLIGSRVLSSTGALTTQGLAPNRFGDKFRSETAAHFERDRDRVVFSTNAPEAVLLPGAQDQLSIFMQLASMLAGEPERYPPGAAISMQAVGTRIAEPWTFSIDAPEALTLPGGTQQTVRLTRLPRREFDQKVELWLAPALGYLPARIRITQRNGDFIDQQWRSTAKP